MNGRIAIMLTVLFISVGLRDVFTILHFYSNQAFIIENFCVNKDQPEKSCQGKCYLIKQLEENDGKQSEDLPFNRSFSHFELKMLPKESVIHGLLANKLDGKGEYSFESLLYTSDYSSRVFQPPEILS